MTAINVILHRDAAHVLTDGAAFAGNVMSHRTAKAFPLPHLNAVVAVSGTPIHAPLLTSMFSAAADSFDALKAFAVEHIRGAEGAQLLDGVVDRRFACVVAGISGSGRPEAYCVTNDPRMAQPHTVQSLGSVAMIPATPELHARFQATFSGIEGGNDLDPVTDGIRLLDLQRETAAWGVGAFAQLTTVTAAGITTRIIHRWASTPDLGAADAA